MVVIDLKRGGVFHDLTSPQVVELLIEVAGWSRCRAVIISVECRTWSAALLLPDAYGNPGKPYRDIDNVLGFKGPDGRVPPNVEAHNAMARAGAAIARANVTHGGAVLAETPACRRAGTSDAIPGCERHVYMYDHPSWKSLIAETDAVEIVIDQCYYLDDHVNAIFTGPKATAILAIGAAKEPARKEFTRRRCPHAPGTHKPLRGVNEKGVYNTRGSEEYPAKLCAAFARVIRAAVTNITGGEVSALTRVQRTYWVAGYHHRDPCCLFREQ